MKKEDLIVSLIQCNMQHCQLVLNLENIGLEDRVGVFDINLMEIVAWLMCAKKTEIDDEWMETYLNFMNEAANYKVTRNGTSLKSLAEKCYEELKEVLPT
ncbi:hypothetical protein [Abyssalbus ytuae]|uniref:Uncharacterized protein n=1 Tax=Abyssalbus ytuae TaxID=2926907 RepID=A0A9E6ZVD5_9FLAO|nr:hypothetical protein [Abyssalbus ytuae]UOB17491.1 hypothetical protein MQE35_17360 [Abyssalbus ytuae]